MNILIVEDEYLMSSSIKKICYKLPSIKEVDILDNFDNAYNRIYAKKYDVILLDIYLENSKYNGLDLCRVIRKIDPDIPIIIITSYQSVFYLEKAFKLGVNDYIIKPFHPKELELRLSRWLFAQYKMALDCQIFYHELSYDSHGNQFFFENKQIDLTKKNKTILLTLIKKPEKLITKEYLHEKLWNDYDYSETNRNLRSNIQILRSSLKGYCKTWIHTIRGEGYMLKKN